MNLIRSWELRYKRWLPYKQNHNPLGQACFFDQNYLLLFSNLHIWNWGWTLKLIWLFLLNYHPYLKWISHREIVRAQNTSHIPFKGVLSSYFLNVITISTSTSRRTLPSDPEKSRSYNNRWHKNTSKRNPHSTSNCWKNNWKNLFIKIWFDKYEITKLSSIFIVAHSLKLWRNHKIYSHKKYRLPQETCSFLKLSEQVFIKSIWNVSPRVHYYPYSYHLLPRIYSSIQWKIAQQSLILNHI